MARVDGGLRMRHGVEPPGAMLQRLLDNAADLTDLVDPDEGIDLGQELRQFVAEPLRQTARNDQTLPAVFRLPQLGRFENRVDALLLCRVDKRTGVNDDDIRLACVVGNFDAVFEQVPHHDFRIDQVFGAAERNQSHAHGARSTFLFHQRPESLR